MPKTDMTFPIVLTDADEPLFLCIWEGGSIVEIHTEDSLRKEFADSNLFDPECTDWAPLGRGHLPVGTFDQVLRYMAEEPEDLTTFVCENMSIQKINSVGPKPSPVPQ